MPKSVPDRVARMLEILTVNQTQLAALASTSKAMVNHWATGKVKSIGACYAFSLQRKAGLNAEWVLFGTGPETLAEVKYTPLVAQEPAIGIPLSPNGNSIGNARESRVEHWPFAPASEADYQSLTPAGQRFVKAAVALAIDEAKALYGTDERKRSA